MRDEGVVAGEWSATHRPQVVAGPEGVQIRLALRRQRHAAGGGLLEVDASDGASGDSSVNFVVVESRYRCHVVLELFV